MSLTPQGSCKLTEGIPLILGLPAHVASDYFAVATNGMPDAPREAW